MKQPIKESVILVDQQGIEHGTMEKYDAHKKGKLHRAFSIFILNDNQQLLLQKRAHTKYHSAGLWSNTCCSHPRPGENIYAAGKRRLMEEMGFECPIEEQFSFIYKIAFDNQLIEHEYDHVFIGIHNEDPLPAPAEVAEWKWMDIASVSNDLEQNQFMYTYWFYLIWNRLLKKIMS